MGPSAVKERKDEVIERLKLLFAALTSAPGSFQECAVRQNVDVIHVSKTDFIK